MTGGSKKFWDGGGEKRQCGIRLTLSEIHIKLTNRGPLEWDLDLDLDRDLFLVLERVLYGRFLRLLGTLEPPEAWLGQGGHMMFF